jgi:lysophospholipase L1-like esterase
VITTNTLAVSALGTNLPAGAYVQFVLDDANVDTDTSPPYTALFVNVPQGEHKVDVILRDSLGGVLAQDSNIVIGMAGGYYVAIGDSITNGRGDDDPSDNTSLDGRTIANQGYEANLNDLLTATRIFPHIVFNEGIGGDQSSDTLGRIDSILERHPQSNKLLILLGTNDSARVVSANTFRIRMQSLVNTVVSSGKEAWVALVPPVFNPDGTPNNSRNQLIEQYNDVIINQLSDVAVGPDFYNFFLDKFNTHYADTEHPNGRGYAAMAQEWHDVLIP